MTLYKIGLAPVSLLYDLSTYSVILIRFSTSETHLQFTRDGCVLTTKSYCFDVLLSSICAVC